jgi:hypothetical protein
VKEVVSCRTLPRHLSGATEEKQERTHSEYSHHSQLESFGEMHGALPSLPNTAT